MSDFSGIPKQLEPWLPAPAADLLVQQCPVIHRRWAASPELVKLTSKFLHSNSFPKLVLMPEKEQAMQQIRRWRNAAFASLTVRDFADGLHPRQLANDWSACAEIMLQTAWDWVVSQTEGATKEILEQTVVMGFGKLGGRELNLSSDVDIAFFCRPEHPESFLELRAAVGKWLRLYLDVLSSTTADGFVFRTDLRLRPQGDQGNLIDPINAAVLYYRDLSAPWERVALLRCRPVAGNLAIGEDFLTEIRPVLFKKHLDYIIIDEIHSVKRKIDFESRVRITGAQDLKLGVGGIREAEFFTQALQLLHGGRVVELQCKEEQRALEILAETEILTPEESTQMMQDYWLLRAIENRIQQREDLQTHRFTPEDLPIWEQSLKPLLDGRPLAEVLDQARERIHSLFASLHKKEDDHFEPSELTLAMISEKLNLDEKAALLSPLGVEDTESVVQRILALHEGLEERTYGRLTKSEFASLAPKLIDAVWDAPDPERALRNMDRFIHRVGGRAEIYALLRQNKELISLLLRLFSTTGKLTDMLIRSPGLLDGLVGRGYFGEELAIETYSSQLQAVLPQDAEDVQEYLDLLARWCNEKILQIGLHNLGGMLQPVEAAKHLTQVADLSLLALQNAAGQNIAKRFDLDLADLDKQLQIVALGRYGGRELGFGSDLDVVFLFRDGTWSREQVTRVLQRVHNWMATTTRWGALFELDARLRPGGNSGALLATEDSFVEYHKKSAQPWEQLPLLKARSVGNGWADFDALIARTLRSYPDISVQLPELERVRNRNVSERGPKEIIKASAGGILDLEFAVAIALLANLDTNPRPAISFSAQVEQLSQMNWFESKDAQRLNTSYHFLRALQGLTDLLGIKESWDAIARTWPKLCGLYPEYLSAFVQQLSEENGDCDTGQEGVIASLLRDMTEVNAALFDDTLSRCRKN